MTENITIESLIAQLERDKKINLGPLGTLRMNDRGGLFLDSPVMVVKPQILTESEILAKLNRYIEYLKNPKYQTGNKKKPGTLSGLKDMVK